MSEIVPILSRTTATTVLFQSLILACKALEEAGEAAKAKELYAKGQNVEVEVRINGIEVPFSQSVEEALNQYGEQIEKDFNKAVEDRALELLKGENIRPLLDKLESIEWELKQALREASRITGVALDE